MDNKKAPEREPQEKQLQTPKTETEIVELLQKELAVLFEATLEGTLTGDRAQLALAMLEISKYLLERE